jgi:hypothetical protein
MASQFKYPSTRNGFKIGIVCAIKPEWDAMKLLLDEQYETDGFSYLKQQNDPNVPSAVFSTASIGRGFKPPAIGEKRYNFPLSSGGVTPGRRWPLWVNLLDARIRTYLPSGLVCFLPRMRGFVPYFLDLVFRLVDKYVGETWHYGRHQVPLARLRVPTASLLVFYYM